MDFLDGIPKRRSKMIHSSQNKVSGWKLKGLGLFRTGKRKQRCGGEVRLISIWNDKKECIARKGAKHWICHKTGLSWARPRSCLSENQWKRTFYQRETSFRYRGLFSLGSKKRPAFCFLLSLLRGPVMRWNHPNSKVNKSVFLSHSCTPSTTSFSHHFPSIRKPIVAFHATW